MLSTSQMQRLVAVADNDTITKAAKSLYLTQPALSRSLRKIEDELGVELFEHVEKNKLRFNEAGLKLVEASRDILQRIEAIENSLKESRHLSNVIPIGACTPPALWSVLPKLAQQFPELVFSTIIDSTTVLEKALLESDITAAFIAKPINTPDYISIPWAAEHLFVVFPENNPLHDAAGVTLEELDGQTFLIQNHVGDWLTIVNELLPNSRILLQEDRATLMGIARKSSLPRFMSNMTMSFNHLLPGEVAVPVKGPGSELKIYFAYRRDLPSHIFDAFCAQVNGWSESSTAEAPKEFTTE